MGIKHGIVAALALAGALSAGAANAGGVSWSIGINAPIYPAGSIGTVISGGPGYGAPQRYYAPPPPRYYAPAPVVVYPAPVVSYPRYAPPVVYVPPPRYHRHDGWRHDRRWDRRDGWRDRR